MRYGQLSELLMDFDDFLIDQFGVLIDETYPYKKSVSVLQRLNGDGKNSVVITNSGKRADYNVQRLVRMGFPIDSFEKVVSSGGGA